MRNFLFILCLLFFPFVLHAQNVCEEILAASIVPKKINFSKVLIAKDVYEKYRDRIASLNNGMRVLFENAQALDLLIDDSAPVSRERLLTLLDSLKPRTTHARLQGILKKQLFNYVPQSQIPSRIQDFLNTPTFYSLRRVLGEKSIEETQDLVYGADPFLYSLNF